MIVGKLENLFLVQSLIHNQAYKILIKRCWKQEVILSDDIQANDTINQRDPLNFVWQTSSSHFKIHGKILLA